MSCYIERVWWGVLVVALGLTSGCGLGAQRVRTSPRAVRPLPRAPLPVPAPPHVLDVAGQPDEACTVDPFVARTEKGPGCEGEQGADGRHTADQGTVDPFCLGPPTTQCTGADLGAGNDAVLIDPFCGTNGS